MKAWRRMWKSERQTLKLNDLSVVRCQLSVRYA